MKIKWKCGEDTVLRRIYHPEDLLSYEAWKFDLHSLLMIVDHLDREFSMRHYRTE